MKYAETGFSLEIDFSLGRIDKVESDPGDTDLYLGGQGIATKILFERVPPEVDPFSPDNLLIFSTGLLNGTPAPSANRTVVNTFSPQTNLMSHSLFGGFFGAKLKDQRVQGAAGCLTYEERRLEMQVDERVEREAMERGLASLLNQHGVEAVINRVKQLSKGQ